MRHGLCENVPVAAFDEDVVSKLPDAVYQSGNEIFVDAAVALEVVGLAEEAEVAILGIDGFMVKEPLVYPSFDRIADFSRTMESDHRAAVRRTVRQARELLASTWADPPEGAPEGQMHPDGLGGRYMFVFVFAEGHPRAEA